MLLHLTPLTTRESVQRDTEQEKQLRPRDLRPAPKRSVDNNTAIVDTSTNTNLATCYSVFTFHTGIRTYNYNH